MKGYLFGQILFLIAVVYLYYRRICQHPRRLKKANKEPCVWLNTLIGSVLTHFRTNEGEQMIVEKAKENGVNLHLRTIGDNPNIEVSCFENFEDVPKVNIDLSWKNGPSFDLTMDMNCKEQYPFKVYFDLYSLKLVTQVWKNTNASTSLPVSACFYDDIGLDFNVTIELFNKIKLSPMTNPITKMIFDIILREVLLNTKIN